MKKYLPILKQTRLTAFWRGSISEKTLWHNYTLERRWRHSLSQTAAFLRGCKYECLFLLSVQGVVWDRTDRVRADRVFTTEAVSYPEIVHIGAEKDFTPVIQRALEPIFSAGKCQHDAISRRLFYKLGIVAALWFGAITAGYEKEMFDCSGFDCIHDKLHPRRNAAGTRLPRAEKI